MYTKIIAREDGYFELMSIGMKREGTKKAIIKFIRIMMDSFPLDDSGEIIKEDDQKSRFILPILKPLFDNWDDENFIYFKVTNDNNAECRQKMSDLSRRRPDGQFKRKRQNTIT